MPEPTVLLLSTSDTDLISARSSGKNYRWANPSRLSDLELTDLLAEASIVVIRILGGYRAWQSGIDTVIAGGVPAVLVSGEQAADAELTDRSTVAAGTALQAPEADREQHRPPQPLSDPAGHSQQVTDHEEGAVRKQIPVGLVLRLPERQVAVPQVGRTRQEAQRVGGEVQLGVGGDLSGGLGERQRQRYRADHRQPFARQRRHLRPGGRLSLRRPGRGASYGYRTRPG